MLISWTLSLNPSVPITQSTDPRSIQREALDHGVSVRDVQYTYPLQGI